MAIVTTEKKREVLEQLIKTPAGRDRLAVSMVKPMLTRLNFKSLPSRISVGGGDERWGEPHKLAITGDLPVQRLKEGRALGTFERVMELAESHIKSLMDEVATDLLMTCEVEAKQTEINKAINVLRGDEKAEGSRLLMNPLTMMDARRAVTPDFDKFEVVVNRLIPTGHIFKTKVSDPAGKMGTWLEVTASADRDHFSFTFDLDFSFELDTSKVRHCKMIESP